MAPVHEALNLLLTELPLLPADAKALKKDRGFTEQTIIDRRFRSCGPHAADAAKKVRETVGDEAVLKCGIFIEGRNGPRIHPDLLTANILIPFVLGGQLVYWQTHKKALSSDIAPIQMYVPDEDALPDESVPMLAEQRRRVVIAESAFKAVAAHQYGFPSIGLPGVSSFTGKHYQRLVDYLTDRGCRSLCIVFDNEVKDGTEGRKVDDPMKRWDTQFYAWLLAYKLGREDDERGDRLFDVSIGTLPDAWRVEGKIDIDGALAAGKTEGEFAHVVDRSVKAFPYLDQEKKRSAEAMRVLARKVDEHFFNSNAAIREDKMRVCYYIEKVVGEDKPLVRINVSDFLFQIRNRYETPDGTFREVVLRNARGDISKPFQLSPEQMASVAKFKEFCYAIGPFTWTGSNKQMQEVFQLEFLRQDGRLIRQPNHVGWVADAGGWLFGNCLVKPGGTVVTPDTEGVIWLDEEGWSAGSIQRGQNTADTVPKIDLSGRRPDFPEVVDHMVANWCGAQSMKLCVGWVCACLCSHWIFEEFKAFPLLFIEGKSKSGKTTLSRWLAQMGGMDNLADNIEDTTAVAIGRNMQWLSSLPYELIEYRHKREVRRKDGILRSAWDRQGVTKGLRTEFGTRRVVVRAGVMVSGEDMPPDHATQTRFAIANLKGSEVFSRTEAGSNKHYNAINRLGRRLSSLVLHVAERVGKPEDFIEHCREMVHWLEERGTHDERTSFNFGVAAAAYDYFVRDNDAEFVQWLEGAALTTRVETDSEGIVPSFLADLDEMMNKKMINGNSVHRGIRDKEGIFIHLETVYSAWQTLLRQRGSEESWTKRAIRSAIKGEDWYVGDGPHYFDDGKTRHALRLDFRKVPKILQQLVLTDHELTEQAAIDGEGTR